MQKILFLTLFSCSTVFVFSQGKTPFLNHFSFGPKAGVNVSTIATRPSTSSHYSSAEKARIAFTGGAFFQIRIKNLFHLQSEIIYSQQGARMVSGPEGRRNSYPYYAVSDRRLDYLKVPLLIKRKVFTGFSAEAGAGVSFLKSAKAKVIETRNVGRLGTTDTYAYQHNKDRSLIVGFGYLSKWGIGMNIRYDHGLSNIYKVVGSDEKWYNRIMQATLFYQIGKR